MFRLLFISALCLLVANAQPLSCREDAHCSEGYFCTQANMCHKCLQCQDFQREPPKLDVSKECIKSIHSCGSCYEGFVNIYRSDVKGKCVIPEFFVLGSHYAYLWITGAVIGLLIVATFVYVIKHTDVFRVVAYYSPVSGNPLPDSSIPSRQHLLKYLLNFNKNQDNK